MNRRWLLRWPTVGSGAAALLAARASSAERRQCLLTGSDVRGPFYLPGAPQRTALAGPDEPGDRLVIRGTIFGPDCTTPLPGALLDAWQADANGNYHGAAEAYRLRGQGSGVETRWRA